MTQSGYAAIVGAALQCAQSEDPDASSSADKADRKQLRDAGRGFLISEFGRWQTIEDINDEEPIEETEPT